jgi:hypothetical protein
MLGQRVDVSVCQAPPPGSLMHLVGLGAARWKGTVVAAKIMEHSASERRLERELLLSTSLMHPNVVSVPRCLHPTGIQLAARCEVPPPVGSDRHSRHAASKWELATMLWIRV